MDSRKEGWYDRMEGRKVDRMEGGKVGRKVGRNVGRKEGREEGRERWKDIPSPSLPLLVFSDFVLELFVYKHHRKGRKSQQKDTC